MLRSARSPLAWLALLSALTANATLVLQDHSVPGGQVLVETAVSRPALTPDNHPVGPVRVKVALLREPAGVRLQATWAYDLPFPAVANGQLTLFGRHGRLLVRSNPRQLATLRAGAPQATLTTPLVEVPAQQAGELCGQADLNVWYDFETAATSSISPSRPALVPTTFHVRVCTSDGGVALIGSR